MKFQYTAIAAGVLYALSSVSQAQDVLQAINVEAEGIAPSTSYISSADYSPARESGDLLREITGVSGTRKGGHGTDPVIRGQRETRLNVLLDGAYVHGGCPSRMDPPTSYAASGNYEEITIIKGVQTLEYGGGGSGGTVLFERMTERFDEEEAVRGSIEAGYRDNSDTSDIAADIAAGNETGFARIILSQRSADNYSDGNGVEILSSYEEQAGTLVLGLTPSTEERFEFVYENHQTDDALFPGLNMDAVYADNTTTRLKYRTKGELGPFSNLKAELYLSEVEHLMDNYTLRNVPNPDFAAPSQSETTGGRVVVGLESTLGSWKFGLDHQGNTRDAQRNNRAGVLQSVLWPGVEIKQTGIFGELTHSLSGHNRIVAGLRYDYVQASGDAGKMASNPTATGGPSTRDIPNNLYASTYGVATSTAHEERNENNIGGLLRFEQDLDDGQGTVYASMSRAVRTADASERYLARWMGVAAMVGLVTQISNPKNTIS